MSEEDLEYIPLPHYSWTERPASLPLDSDEAATAIHLAHGCLHDAAELLKVPEVRLHRLVKGSPRLQRVLTENYELALARAATTPIRTLYDPDADHRRLEWASTKLMQTRLAQSHLLAPASQTNSAAASLAVNGSAREIVFRWKSPESPAPTIEGELIGDSSDGGA